MSPAPPSHRRRWITADVVCLHCGRALGLLVGPGVVAAGAGQGLVFRPASSALPVRRVAPGERFACAACGGPGVIGEMAAFTSYHEVVEAVEGGIPRRRGRPPKATRRPVDARLVELGLARQEAS